ncbi:MAG: hypothetical protein ABII07_03625 [Patescibacteria group bacterium]|nr:hypothetical protein [Patescibacteria group bacterium]
MGAELTAENITLESWANNAEIQTGLDQAADALERGDSELREFAENMNNLILPRLEKDIAATPDSEDAKKCAVVVARIQAAVDKILGETA